MRLFALLAAAVLAGCASPEPALFTMAALPGTARAGGPASVQLRRIGLAGYLDRPEIVRAGSDYRLRVATGERWGEPFGDMLGRLLAEDLTRRLPGTSVFTEAGAISAKPDATVEIDLQRFDADPTNTVTLLAQYAVTRGSEPAATRTVRLTTQPRDATTSALVAAMSEALAQFSDRIADSLRTR